MMQFFTIEKRAYVYHVVEYPDPASTIAAARVNFSKVAVILVRNEKDHLTTVLEQPGGLLGKQYSHGEEPPPIQNQQLGGLLTTFLDNCEKLPPLQGLELAGLFAHAHCV